MADNIHNWALVQKSHSRTMKSSWKCLKCGCVILNADRPSPSLPVSPSILEGPLSCVEMTVHRVMNS